MAQANRELPRLGAKVRTLRRRENLSQVQLAERLGVSASYLNLIEANRRPLPAALLIKLAQIFEIDLTSFATEHDIRLVGDLLEAFSDPLFDPHELNSVDVRELAANSPGTARAVLMLYRAYKGARESAEALAARMSEGELTGVDLSRLPSEEVSDVIQRHVNHFPELEDGAENLWQKA